MKAKKYEKENSAMDKQQDPRIEELRDGVIETQHVDRIEK
jgi:hypothetical protein